MVTFLRNNLLPHINPFEIDAQLVLRGLLADIACPTSSRRSMYFFYEDFHHGLVE